MRLVLLVLPLSPLWLSATALADPPDDDDTDDRRLITPSRYADDMDGACSYTTSMFARRVLDEGEAWSYTGHLIPATESLGNRVAAPYVIGQADGARLVATELLETVHDQSLEDAELSLTGKRLLLGETTYFVLTGVSATQPKP